MKYFFLFLLAVCAKNILQAQSSYRFKNYTINEGLSQSSVTCVIQDKSNAIWIGTQDGLNRFDGKTFEIFNSDNTKGIESEYIRCSAKTLDENLWFGTLNGLTKYDFKKEKFKTFSFLKNTPLQVEKIAVDKAGNLWLASLTSGLLLFDSKTEKITSYSFLLPSSKVQTIFHAENGELFVSTEDKGLYRCNIKKKTIQRVYIPYLKDVQGSILKIMSCEKDKILFCTTQGVFEYSIKKKTTILKFNKFQKEYGNLEVGDIMLTENKNWILATVNNGLFTFDLITF